MPSNNHTLKLIIAAGLLLPAVSLAGDQRSSQTPAVQTPALSSQSLLASRMQMRLVGIARPAQYAEVTAPVTGRITSIPVRVGDQVSAGDLLVVLDDRIPRAAVAVAEAEAAQTASLEAATIAWRLAEQQLRRTQLAYDRGAGSQFEIDEKTAERDQAATDVARQRELQAKARAALLQAQAELDQYSIRAPFDGEIIQVQQKTGATIDRSKAVLVIADRRSLEVELHLPLAHYGQLKPDGVVSLHAGAPVHRTLESRVISVSPHVNAASRTFRVSLRIDNAGRELPSGFTVRQSETNQLASSRDASTSDRPGSKR